MEIKQVISECVTEAFLDGIRGRVPIPASTLFSWASPAILKAFGEDWLDAGWLDITYLLPVFAGEIVATRLLRRNHDHGPLELVMVNQDNVVVASGWVGMGLNPAWVPVAKKMNGPKLPTPPPTMAISIAATSATDDDDNCSSSSSLSSTSSQVVVAADEAQDAAAAPHYNNADDEVEEANVVVDVSAHRLTTSSTSSSLALPTPLPPVFVNHSSLHNTSKSSSSSSIILPSSQTPSSPQASLAAPAPAPHLPHHILSHPPASAAAPFVTLARSASSPAPVPASPRNFPMPMLKEVSTQPIEILPKSIYITAPKAKEYVRREAKDVHNALWFRAQNPPVHPGWIVEQMSQLIQHSYRRLPLLYTNIKLQFFSRVVSGQRVTTTGHFRRAYDQNSNHVSVVDGLLLGEQGQRLAQMQNTTIFQMRAAL